MENKRLLNYPEHNHPHGVDDTQPNEQRIWVCEECLQIFGDAYIREDFKKDWGHRCKQFHGTRCESHLESYIPEINGAEATADAFIEAGKEIATREILALTENIFNLAINGDYTNGNNAYGLDEGRVRASEPIEDFDKQLEALKQKYL